MSRFSRSMSRKMRSMRCHSAIPEFWKRFAAVSFARRVCSARSNNVRRIACPLPGSPRLSPRYSISSFASVAWRGTRSRVQYRPSVSTASVNTTRAGSWPGWSAEILSPVRRPRAMPKRSSQAALALTIRSAKGSTTIRGKECGAGGVENGIVISRRITKFRKFTSHLFVNCAASHCTTRRRRPMRPFMSRRARLAWPLLA